jgi:twitching motility protein PilT
MDLVSLLTAAAQREASDVHLTHSTPPMARIHGVIVPLDEICLSPETCRDLVFSALTEMQRSRLEETFELDFILDIEEVGRFRANAHYARGYVEAAFRLIPKNIPDLLSLGHRESMLQLCEKEEGLILVTGTTGSGKSTTLASMIERIAQSRTGVIVTIEDPIEYIFENRLCIIKQREVGSDTKTFNIALRHVLRQDPDIIVISEMRDRETVQAAITAAETGHLVLGSLHTIDAAKTIDRLVDIFPADQQNQIVTQLSNCLHAIVSQRLLPRADALGRVIATEIMMANNAIRACIRDRKPHMIPGFVEIGAGEGMHSLDESLGELLHLGLISHEEARINARDPASLPDPPQEKKRGFFGRS